MPSRSTVARSIAARRSSARFGVQHGVLQPGAGAGDRGAQVVRDGVGNLAHAVHQPADAVQHVVNDLGDLIEFIAAAGQLDPLSEVAACDGDGRRGDIGQRAAEQVADDQRADRRHQDHDDGGPQQRIGQHFAQLRPHLTSRPISR